MNSKQLTSFINIATCGSFSKAAEISYITRSALLQQINSLEEEIGTPLFRRTSSGVFLTAAGEIFFQNAKFLLQCYDTTVQKCKESALDICPIIRVGVYSDFPSLMTSDCSILFKKRFSEYDIQYISFSSDSFLHHVTSDTLDIFESPRLSFPNGADFRFLPLLKDRPCLLMCADTPLLADGKEWLCPNDLRGLSIRIPHNCPQFLQVLLDLKKEEPLLSYEEASYSYYPVLENTMKGQVYLIPESYGPKYAPLKCIPIAGNLTIELGFSYRKEITTVLEKFLCITKRLFTK